MDYPTLLECQCQHRCRSLGLQTSSAIAKLVLAESRRVPEHQRSRAPVAQINESEERTRTMRPAAKEVTEAKEVARPLVCRRLCRSNLGFQSRWAIVSSGVIRSSRAPDHQCSRAPASQISVSEERTRTMCPAAREVIEVKELVLPLACRGRCRNSLGLKGSRLLWARGKVVELTKRGRAPAPPTAKNRESEKWTRTTSEIIEIGVKNHNHGREVSRRAIVKLFGAKDRERAGCWHSRAPATKIQKAGRQLRTMCLAVQGVIELKQVVDHPPYHRRRRSKVGNRLLRMRGKVVELTKRGRAPAPTAKNHEPEKGTRTTLEVIEIGVMDDHGQEDNWFLQAIVILVRVKESSNRHRGKTSAAKFHEAGTKTRTTCPVMEAKQAVEPQVNHNRGQTVLEDNLNIRLVAQTGPLTKKIVLLQPPQSIRAPHLALLEDLLGEGTGAVNQKNPVVLNLIPQQIQHDRLDTNPRTRILRTFKVHWAPNARKILGLEIRRTAAVIKAQSYLA